MKFFNDLIQLFIRKNSNSLNSLVHTYPQNRFIKKIGIVCLVFIGFLGASQNIDTSKGTKYKIIAVSAQNNTTSHSNVVEIIQPLNLYVPNAFTPNNDGLNDFFSVYGEGVKSLEISIFDRWGKKVYGSISFDSWDGKINGEICQAGVYVYKIEAIGHDKKYIQKSGTVSIIL